MPGPTLRYHTYLRCRVDCDGPGCHQRTGSLVTAVFKRMKLQTVWRGQLCLPLRPFVLPFPHFTKDTFKRERHVPSLQDTVGMCLRFDHLKYPRFPDRCSSRPCEVLVCNLGVEFRLETFTCAGLASLRLRYAITVSSRNPLIIFRFHADVSLDYEPFLYLKLSNLQTYSLRLLPTSPILLRYFFPGCTPYTWVRISILHFPNLSGKPYLITFPSLNGFPNFVN